MKAWQLAQWSLEHLALVERPEPRPGPGEVLLRLKAASLNSRDLVVARRGYGPQTGELPLVPVSDGVGEVLEVGAGVTRVAVGDRVCPAFFQEGKSLGGPHDGVMAQYRVFDQSGVVKIPAHLSDEEAATLPCAALTAWSAVVVEGRAKPGDSVLVQGTGGVSLFALQFAKLCGARVTVVSGSDAKLERAKALGADAGFNYRATPEWGKESRGRDLVVDVGGAQSVPQALRAVRAGGTIALIGVVSGQTAELALGPVVTRGVRLQGIRVGAPPEFESMLRAVGACRLRPVVDKVFGFGELRAALDYLASGAHFGKICLRIA
ncbi:MAG: zinc-dependent alcohol dehydrogenase family protein [Betaproteobacteria bacterium]